MDKPRRSERIRIASSLVGLALEFALLGVLILAKGDSEGISMAGGFVGIFLGATFLMFAVTFGRSATAISDR
jgi:succinate-acetate transporter protein